MEPIVIITKFVNSTQKNYNSITSPNRSNYYFVNDCIKELNLTKYNSNMIYKLVINLDNPNNFIFSLFELNQWNIINRNQSMIELIKTYNGIENIDWNYNDTLLSNKNTNSVLITLKFLKRIINIQGDRMLFSYISAIYAGIQLLQYKCKLENSQNTTHSALDAFATLSLMKKRSLSEIDSDSSDNESLSDIEYQLV